MTPLYSALAGPRKASDLQHINLVFLAERKGVAMWKLFTEQYPMQKSLWFCLILRVISLHFNANAYQMDDCYMFASPARLSFLCGHVICSWSL